MTTNGSSKNKKKWDEVLIDLFREHPEWNAPQFQRQLEVLLTKEKTPGLSAVQKKLPIIRQNYGGAEEEMDSPWSIAICANPKYVQYFPHGFIPLLLKEKRLRIETNLGPKDLTIQDAIWFVRLYPAVIEVVKNLFPDNDAQTWHGICSIASRQYAERELATKVTRNKVFDTKDLDYWLFIKEDPNCWKSLRDIAIEKLKQGRDLSYVQPESEPPKLETFTLFYDFVKEKIPSGLSNSEQLRPRYHSKKGGTNK